MNARFLLPLALIFSVTQLHAQWQTDGFPVSAATGHQIKQVIVSDTTGAIVVWEDYRGGEPDIYARKVTPAGAVQWAADGMVICNAAKLQLNPVAVSDGAGGVIVVWEDYRTGVNATDLYAQRISASGSAMWPANGVLLASQPNVQWRPMIVSDGQGGAIVAWEDYRSGFGDVFVQRISSSGSVLWQTDGVPVATVSGTRYGPVIAVDGSGGAIIAWEENRTATEYDIYAQRINGSGVTQWGTGGLVVCTATGQQTQLAAYSTGTGNMLLAWQDFRHSSGDIYAHILTPAGLAFTGSGAAVCTDAATQEYPRPVPDGSGGMIVAWADYRVAAGDIYARRVNASGVPQWASNGVALCTNAATQNNVDAAPHGLGGAIVTWTDYRIAKGDVYVQAIDNSGTPLSLTNGSPVCTHSSVQQGPVIARDYLNGAYVAWTDYRAGTGDIYVHRVNRYGTGLPVELLSFSGSRIGPDVQLRWRTAAEVNVHGFEVQASVDGAFSTIGFIAAISQDGAEYEYRALASEATVYRLRIVDYDGSVTFSPELSVAASNPGRIAIASLSPLPARESLTVTFESPSDTPRRISVYDVTGRIRMQFVSEPASAGREVRMLDVSSLPAGMYLLEVVAGVERASAMFPVQR